MYRIKHMSIQPFNMGVSSPEMGRLMEISIMFDIYTYCILLCRDELLIYACLDFGQF